MFHINNSKIIPLETRSFVRFELSRRMVRKTLMSQVDVVQPRLEYVSIERNYIVMIHCQLNKMDPQQTRVNNAVFRRHA